MLRAVVLFLLRGLVYAVLGACALVSAIVVGFAVRAHFVLPELHAWHTMELPGEFSVGRADAPRSFDEYRHLEDRLRDELRRRILDDPEAADSFILGRYDPQSIPSKLALENPARPGVSPPEPVVSLAPVPATGPAKRRHASV